MYADIIIVGGGASGITAGIAASQGEKKIILLEQKDKLGKKILATGNGKCNYTNRIQDISCYRGKDPFFAMEVLRHFDMFETVRFFKRLGIEPKVKNGYYYPASEQASSVLEVLKQELLHNKVNINCGKRVIQISKIKTGFRVHTKDAQYECKKMILSAGGCAYPGLGSDGSGYSLIQSLGHHLISPVPALTGLKAKEHYFSALAGVRVDCSIRLYIDGKLKAVQDGELQLTDYGISGIPVFQISRFASMAILKGQTVTCSLDFFQHDTKDTLFELLKARVKENGYKTMKESMVGLIHNKLAYVFITKAGLSLKRISAGLSDREWRRLVDVMKGLQATIVKPCDFDKAQVTAGGVRTDEVNPETLESKLVPGLYITGELLDIDGACGGYNLQWAWSTGYLAGKHANESTKKGKT